MKLKTLKDLEINLLARSRLKQEAIKWVKETPDEDGWLCFIEFFNITKEDLK